MNFDKIDLDTMRSIEDYFQDPRFNHLINFVSERIENSDRCIFKRPSSEIELTIREQCLGASIELKTLLPDFARLIKSAVQTKLKPETPE